MIGDVFVTTFDGRIFLHPGVCQYVLVKSRGSSRLTVTLQYTTCAEVFFYAPINVSNIHTHTHSSTLQCNILSSEMHLSETSDPCVCSSRCASSRSQRCWMKM